MKIARVHWAPYSVPFRRPYATSQGISLRRTGLAVALETDDGQTGWGEVALRPAPVPQVETLAGITAGVARSLRGGSPDTIEAGLGFIEEDLATDMFAAVACAFDTALCDLQARAAGASIARYLTPAAADSVEVNTLITAMDAREACRLSAGARRAGYRTVKLKVGDLLTLEAETERIASVRESLGPDAKLRLDANGAWTVEQAIEAIRSLEAYDIEYVEQPVPPGDIEQLTQVQHAVAARIAADEDIIDLETAARIIETGAASVLVVKPQQLGGIRRALQICRQANEAGLVCVVTTSIETGIGTAACLQTAAALPGNGIAHGLATAQLLVDDLTSPRLPVVAGRMSLPASPGLGVSLDLERAGPFLGEWREVS